MTLCAQDEAPPYGYVSVEGPVTFAAVDFDAHIIVIAHRYLPPQAAQQYLAPMTKAESESGNVLIRLKPERWRTVDYRKAYGG